MTFRAYVEDDFAAMELRLYLVEEGGPGLRFVHRGPGQGRRLVTTPENASWNPEDRVPFAVIPYGAEHAVLAVLARHLGAVEHPEQLRRDFEHERGRVDLLIGHLARAASLDR